MPLEKLSTPNSHHLSEEYHISSVTPSDNEQVIEFLRKFFFRDEPLNLSVDLLNSETGTCPELEEYSIHTIKDGMSVMATTSCGQIIGVGLNGIISRKDFEGDEEENCPNSKFCKIIKFLKDCEKKSDLFGKYPKCEKVLCVKILSVDGSWRGRGIAKELMDRTRQVARQEGFHLMSADCTSYYSAKALARLGFECLYSIKYADYKEDDEIVFRTDPPHSELKIYVQEI